MNLIRMAILGIQILVVLNNEWINIIDDATQVSLHQTIVVRKHQIGLIFLFMVKHIHNLLSMQMVELVGEDNSGGIMETFHQLIILDLQFSVFGMI